MSTITKHHLEQIREKLPHRYMEELKKRVNNDKLSNPLISAVIHGDKKDYYGIIKAAIKWANEIEAENQAILEQAQELINK